MRLASLALVAICALVLFTGLDRVGFLDVREARDAQVARELLARREGLTPLYGSEPLFEKPLLAYAPEALLRRAAGDGPLPSRWWRAALGLALLLVTGALGARHFGPRAGVLAATVLASCMGLPLAARTDGTQLLGSLLGWVGAAGLADVVFGRDEGRDLRLVVTWGVLATAFVCVGPMPALWPVAGLALYLALGRDRVAWRRARPLAGFAIVVGLALPWYGAMADRHSGEFLRHALFFPYAVEARGAFWTGPVLALSFLVIGFFPWSALLPAAALHAATWWRVGRRPLLSIGPTGPELLAGEPVERERREEGAAHLFVAFLFAALVPVAFYPGPPLPAALPALPAAALLCARFLDHLFEDPVRVQRPFARAVQMLALTGTAGAVLLAVMAVRVREAAPAFRLLATVLFATSWAPFLAQFVGRTRLAAALLALPVALGTPVAALRVLPALRDYLGTRDVAAALNQVAPARAAVILVDPPPPSLRLYARRHLVLVTPLARALEEFRAADGHAYLAFRPAREREVVRTLAGPIEILLRTPALVLARTGAGARRAAAVSGF